MTKSMMIQELRMINFRCFNDHKIPLKDRTVIVGPNNSGKSSTIEALRLISWAIERRKFGNYEPIPSVLRGIATSGKCFRISQELLNKSKSSLFHRYNEPPAVITGVFVGGAAVRVYLIDGGVILCQILNSSSEAVATRNAASRVEVPPIQTLPQVAPLLMKESLIQPDRVRSHLSSPLAPHHFRNQLWLFREHWDEFKILSESTWPGLQVMELVSQVVV